MAAERLATRLCLARRSNNEQRWSRRTFCKQLSLVQQFSLPFAKVRQQMKRGGGSDLPVALARQAESQGNKVDGSMIVSLAASDTRGIRGDALFHPLVHLAFLTTTCLPANSTPTPPSPKVRLSPSSHSLQSTSSARQSSGPSYTTRPASSLLPLCAASARCVQRLRCTSPSMPV